MTGREREDNGGGKSDDWRGILSRETGHKRGPERD